MPGSSRRLRPSVIGIAYPISIQWHITTDCQNNCRHCYVFDPATYAHERDFGLTLEQKLLAMDKLDAFGKKWGFCFPDVILMGGDPLLARDWYEFAMALRKRGKKIAFGGNPESLTAENLNKLKQLDVKRFQLSLDGLEEAHDQQRRPGSFKNTIEGLSRLKKAGIHGSVMATLTPINVEDFWHLLDFVFYETDAYRFAFEFVSRVGNAHGLDVRFTPEQVLALASKYLDIKNTRATERPEFSFVEKPGLFRLLHMARGETRKHWGLLAIAVEDIHNPRTCHGRSYCETRGRCRSSILSRHVALSAQTISRNKDRRCSVP